MFFCEDPLAIWDKNISLNLKHQPIWLEGLPLRHFAMRLVDPEFVPGRPVPKGVFGDIYVCGATALFMAQKLFQKRISYQINGTLIMVFVAICSHVCLVDAI